MSYDSDLPSGKTYRFGVAWIAFAVAMVMVAVAMVYVSGSAFHVVSAPGRVVDKTLQTDNIITSYEWFFDQKAAYEARVGQIKSHLEILKATEDKAEKGRLNIELAAMRQSCRELSTKYAANSAKTNKSVFKDKDLPETLPATACEQQLNATT